MKQKLIRELQDIISEKDEYVSQLEAKLAGKELDIVKPGVCLYRKISVREFQVPRVSLKNNRCLIFHK